ncbi:MAG: hypothetical protein RMY34_29225 [Aulosira sp. DedQUE10]|nr:hypothetical protein [Aulosira sp. DedQUE10]
MNNDKAQSRATAFLSHPRAERSLSGGFLRSELCKRRQMAFRITLAAFNERALRAWKKASFQQLQTSA